MEKKHAGPLYGLSVALLWGFSFLSIKVSVAEVPPMTMAAARFIVACAVLPLLARLVKDDMRIALRDVPMLVLSGLLGVTLYFYFENNGVALLSASEASLIIGTIPVVTMIAERIFIGTRLGARAYVGAFLSFAGVALIVARSGSSESSSLGYLYMVGAALVWVAYTFSTRGVSARYGRISVTFWQCLFGLLGCLPLALLESRAWRVPSTTVVLNILYLGLFCSAAGYWLYISAMNHLGVGRASVFINLIPVVAVVGGFLILGDRLGSLQMVGGAIAVAGVYLATIPGRPQAQE